MKLPQNIEHLERMLAAERKLGMIEALDAIQIFPCEGVKEGIVEAGGRNFVAGWDAAEVALEVIKYKFLKDHLIPTRK